MPDIALDLLLEQLQQLGELPPDQALSLPPAAFTSAQFLQHELKNIFEDEWFCAGRLDEISNPGDYIVFKIANEQIVIVRENAERIHAFSNVCKHRGMLLAHKDGSAKKLVCPYHAWTYNLDGQLMGAPYMSDSSHFNRDDCQLPEFKTAIWQGWIFVTLNSNAECIDEKLSKLDDKLAIYALPNMHTEFTFNDTWQTNWKCLAENFMESYHIFHVHKDTIETRTPTSSVVCENGGEGFAYHLLFERPGVRDGGEGNSALPESIRWQEILACVFPSLLISVTGNILVWLSLQPGGPGAVNIRGGVATAPGYIPAGTEGDNKLAQLRRDFDAFNAEDKAIVEALYKGLQSASASQGQLSSLERPLWEFSRYLGRKLLHA